MDTALTILTVVSGVVAGSSIILKSVAVLTKTDKDDRLADFLDTKLGKFLAALSLHVSPRK